MVSLLCPCIVASFVAISLTTQLGQQTRLYRLADRSSARPAILVELDMQGVFIDSILIWNNFVLTATQDQCRRVSVKSEMPAMLPSG